MILIYTEKLNPRIEYASRLIFTTILKNEVSFTVNASLFLKSKLPKLNYSYKKFSNEFYIKPHRLLHCKALIQPDIQPVWHNGQKYFFESSSDSDLPFDPLAASFYLVTRYEEYLPGERDIHGRFPATESILTKYELLKKPVVNLWARLLGEMLKKRFPLLIFPNPAFEFLPTIDIDNAWAYAHKGFWRGTAALVKDLIKGNIRQAGSRLRVWSGKEPDPYDTYDFLDKMFLGNEKSVLFFFLLANYNRFDKNVSWHNRHLKKMIHKVADKYSAGIHPSYASGTGRGAERLIAEISRLKTITGAPVEKSRQHFLNMQFPQTYRHLIEAGITEDYTMGYPSHTGFRAGICTPYLFYDLKRETTTTLKIIPFQVMDVTLRSYMGLTPNEAMAEVEQLMQEVKNAGGTFSAVWHNETLIDKGIWKGYREVFKSMIHKGFNLANE